MKAIIHYNGDYEDTLVIHGDTIEDIREQAYCESNRRGWDTSKCWSEVEECE